MIYITPPVGRNQNKGIEKTTETKVREGFVFYANRKYKQLTAVMSAMLGVFSVSPSFGDTWNTATAGRINTSATTTKVGIGWSTSTNPKFNLAVSSSTAGNEVSLGGTAFGNIGTNARTALHLERSRGTQAAPVRVEIDDQIGLIQARGYTGSTGGYQSMSYISFDVEGLTVLNQRPGSKIRFFTNEPSATQVERMSISNNGRVAIGTTTPGGGALTVDQQTYYGLLAEFRSGGTNVMSLDHTGILTLSGSISANGAGFTNTLYVSNGGAEINGTVHAREVIVDANWPDFVFRKDYSLMSLDKVENFISKNGHLPEIPAEKEVKAKGVALGTMNAKLLQKIEELTLYVIEQEKRIKKLERASAK